MEQADFVIAELREGRNDLWKFFFFFFFSLKCFLYCFLDSYTEFFFSPIWLLTVRCYLVCVPPLPPFFYLMTNEWGTDTPAMKNLKVFFFPKRNFWMCSGRKVLQGIAAQEAGQNCMYVCMYERAKSVQTYMICDEIAPSSLGRQRESLLEPRHIPAR